MMFQVPIILTNFKYSKMNAFYFHHAITSYVFEHREDGPAVLEFVDNQLSHMAYMRYGNYVMPNGDYYDYT